MHRDKKIGFALGILLVGIVAAFFFRNEPDPFAELPPLDDPGALDALIAEKPIAPYTQETGAPSSEAPIASAPPSPWEISDIFQQKTSPTIASAGLPIAAGAPAPIDLAAPIPIPENTPKTTIEVGNPFGVVVPAMPKPANETPLPGNENWTAGPATPTFAAQAPATPTPAAQKPAAQKPAAQAPAAQTPAAQAPAAETPSGNLVKKPQPPVETPASQTSLYKIVPGDTLSVLAEKHLGTSRRYMEIYEANRDKLRNPDDIKVGMMIRIPPRVKYSAADSRSEAPAPKTPRDVPTPENFSPFEQETATGLPSRPEASRFMPFSRSPLAPLPH